MIKPPASPHPDVVRTQRIKAIAREVYPGLVVQAISHDHADSVPWDAVARTAIVAAHVLDKHLEAL